MFRCCLFFFFIFYFLNGSPQVYLRIYGLIFTKFSDPWMQTNDLVLFSIAQGRSHSNQVLGKIGIPHFYALTGITKQIRVAQRRWAKPKKAQNHARMCLLGFAYIAVYLRGHIPPNPDFGSANRHFQAKRAKNSNSYFRNYYINCNQTLQSDKDRQVAFVGGPNMPQTDPRWWMAAIFKN